MTPSLQSAFPLRKLQYCSSSRSLLHFHCSCIVSMPEKVLLFHTMPQKIYVLMARYVCCLYLVPMYSVEGDFFLKQNNIKDFQKSFSPENGLKGPEPSELICAEMFEHPHLFCLQDRV